MIFNFGMQISVLLDQNEPPDKKFIALFCPGSETTTI